MDDAGAHIQQAAPGVSLGSKETLAANPLPIIFHTKPRVMFPVEKHQLWSIGGSTLFGSLMAAIAGAFYSAFQTYSTALASSLKELSVQTVSDYRVWVVISKRGMIICAVLYLVSMLNVWRGIREIKKSGTLCILSAEGKLIPVDRNQVYPPTRWDKLKAKFYEKIDRLIDWL